MPDLSTLEIEPIFLVGTVRSGSTMLKLILDAHPELINPGEFDFLFHGISDSLTPPPLDEYLQYLSTHRIFLMKNLEIPKVGQFHDVVKSFVKQLSRPGKILIMNVHHNYHHIPAVFPNAKIIHLLRDPRDVARSTIGMGWKGNVYHGIDVWLDAEKNWSKLEKSIDQKQVYTIHYEKLLTDLPNELKGLCQFIGVDYSGNMLGYSDNSTYSAPDSNLAYQWKRKYSRRELQLVEGKLGDFLTQAGYQPSGETPAIPGSIEKIKLMLENSWFRNRYAFKKYGFSLHAAFLLNKLFPIKSFRKKILVSRNQIDEKNLK